VLAYFSSVSAHYDLANRRNALPRRGWLLPGKNAKAVNDRIADATSKDMNRMIDAGRSSQKKREREICDYRASRVCNSDTDS